MLYILFTFHNSMFCYEVQLRHLFFDPSYSRHKDANYAISSLEFYGSSRGWIRMRGASEKTRSLAGWSVCVNHKPSATVGMDDRLTVFF